MTVGPGAVPELEPPADEVRTTHASWVYLRGGDVWKLKRPVNLGFLDFREPEARRRFCEDEVRLNRRLAPDVYVGVVPVRRAARGLSLDGDGPIVDWAVHMKRLPDDASAIARLARGELGAGDLAALATRLAAFHASARETPQAGEAAMLVRNVEENFTQTDELAQVGELVDRRTFDEVRSFQTAWLADHADLLRARIGEGRIREGHGDLRLEHVYFLPGGDGGAPRPVVIDCVEFSERLRCGDTASDAAFLAMELDAERRPDLAAGFLARFAEATDDFGMYAVLDFYLSYRAWVRGKVAAFVAADASVSHETRERKRLEARRRFALARSYAGRPVDAPFVIAVSGLPGSGKSTLAASLGAALAVPVVSSDVTRKAMAGLAPEARGSAELYTDAARDQAYAGLLRRAGLVLGAGRGVVLDATFAARRWRAAAAALAREQGAPFILVDVAVADTAVLKARLARRRDGPSISDATDVELDRITRSHEPLAPDEGLAVIRVDGAGAPARAVEAALEGVAGLGILAAADRRRS